MVAIREDAHPDEIASSNDRSRDALVADHLPLVRSIAFRYRGFGLPRRGSRPGRIARVARGDRPLRARPRRRLRVVRPVQDSPRDSQRVDRPVAPDPPSEADRRAPSRDRSCRSKPQERDRSHAHPGRGRRRDRSVGVGRDRDCAALERHPSRSISLSSMTALLSRRRSPTAPPGIPKTRRWSARRWKRSTTRLPRYPPASGRSSRATLGSAAIPSRSRRSPPTFTCRSSECVQSSETRCRRCATVSSRWSLLDRLVEQLVERVPRAELVLARLGRFQDLADAE